MHQRLGDYLITKCKEGEMQLRAGVGQDIVCLPWTLDLSELWEITE